MYNLLLKTADIANIFSKFQIVGCNGGLHLTLNIFVLKKATIKQTEILVDPSQQTHCKGRLTGKLTHILFKPLRFSD